MPLKHYSIALLLAAIAGGSVWFWFNQKATESASAVLAFDPSAAHLADPGLTLTGKPAIVLSNSILDDQAIATLAKQSHLSSATAASQIGEFRSNLELTQPSSKMLTVQFFDPDPTRSAETTNAVAQVLAAWAPSQAAAPAAHARPQPAAPPPAPASKMAVEAPSQQNHPAATASASSLNPLSDSLGEISDQLSATDRDMDHLAAEHSAGHSDPQAAYTEYKQQQLLKSRVGAAEKKLSDLQGQYGNGAADSGVKGRLTAIQQALNSILRGGEPDANGFRAAGTSASQLARERSQLTHAISIVDQQRQAIKQAAAAHADSSGSSPAPSPTIRRTSICVARAFAICTGHYFVNAAIFVSAEFAAGDSDSSAPQLPSEHPLIVVRVASATPPPPLWPPAAAGFVCFLLYLAGAGLAHRRTGSEDDDDVEDYDEDLASPTRFITPNEPFNPPAEHVEAADLSSTQSEPVEVESTPSQREPFAFFSTPKESDARRRSPFVWDENGEASADAHEDAQEKPTDTRRRTPFVWDANGEASADAHEDAREKPTDARRRTPFVWDENGEASPGAHEGAPENPRVESSQSESSLQSEESTDPVANRLRQNLSQTEIAKLFEESDRDATGVSSTEKNVGREL